MAAAAGTYNDFPDAALLVGMTARILRRKPLVGVFVPCEDQIAVSIVQVLPEGFELDRKSVV